MVDHSTVAELVGYLINGVGEGADSNITKLYEQHMTTTAASLPGEDLFVDVISTVEDLLQEFRGEAIVGRPHFLMLAAAVMYAKGKLPDGRLDFTRVEDASEMLRDRTQIIKAIGDLNTAIETPTEDLDPRALPFIEARQSSQRMPSRQARFEYFCHALAGKSFYDL